TGGQFPVVAVDVSRAPVVSERRIKALGLLPVHAPKGLVCHPVKKIIATPCQIAHRINEPGGIVRRTELIESRVSLSAVHVAGSPHRRSLFAGGEADLGDAHRSSVKLRD